jgi:hypothetical protein
MDIIGKIKDLLDPYPHVRYTELPHAIVVHPVDESGFMVSLHATDSGFTVSFEGWHEEFATESEALGCFAFGLSSDCRLVIVFRGDVETRWIVERLDEGNWIEDSETGLLWQPFWRQARREYRQNRIVRYPICKRGR